MPRPPVTILRPSRLARARLTGQALVLAGAMSGCATGFGAQTTTVYTAPAGTDVRTGDIKGLNLLVVAAAEGSGTLVAALVNTTDEDDQLMSVMVTDIDTGTDTGVDSEDEAGVTVTGLDSPLVLPAGTLVQVAAEDSEIEPIGLSGEAVQTGQVLQIDLVFARGGAVSAEVPVVPRENYYANVPTPPPASDKPAGAEPPDEPDDGG